MPISLIGINHKTAPIEIREKFYLNSTQQDFLLSELKSNPRVVEAFVVSTCNRTEIYLHHIDDDPDVSDFIRLLAVIKKITPTEDFKPYFYSLKNQDAIKHILRVVAGLDSLVLGERQILGQVKTAFDRARERGILSRDFNLLSTVVIKAGKKAHTDTQISVGGSSVSWAAIVMAESILGSLRNKSVLVIGAGKMSELAVGQVSSKGFGKLYLMNRTQENAEKLAKKYHGVTVPFCDIKEVIPAMDLCICSADAPHYILDVETMRKARSVASNKRLVLIDISMPRNIDPNVGDMENILLYHIDDLNKPINENMQKRLDAIKAVEGILEAKLLEFYAKLSKTGIATAPTSLHEPVT